MICRLGVDGLYEGYVHFECGWYFYDEDELLSLAFLRDNWCVNSELDVEDWFCRKRFEMLVTFARRSSKLNSLTVTCDKVVLYVEWIE
jgi:hypothetical protein